MDNEVRANLPMVYYHVWDNLPYPRYNKKWYDSTDVIASISKVTHNIVSFVAPDVENHYLPHGVDSNIFKKFNAEDNSRLKIENFGDTIKGNIDAYDKYVEDNLGISKNVSNVFRAGAVVKGVGAYGLAGALVPFAIPFMAGGALNNKQKKENERITNITNQDTQGSNNTVDMATYGIPTAGQPGFNIHNDKYDGGGRSGDHDGGASAGAQGDAAAGMGGY
jgi:hypothetical protein